MVGQFVLKDPDVRDAIKAGDIVTLKADVTRYNQEAVDLLVSLNHEARTVPFFALFSPDDPDHPRTHSALFTEDDMLDFIGDDEGRQNRSVQVWYKQGVFRVCSFSQSILPIPPGSAVRICAR